MPRKRYGLGIKRQLLGAMKLIGFNRAGVSASYARGYTDALNDCLVTVGKQTAGRKWEAIWPKQTQR